MLHPDLRLQWISDAIGYGIFASRPIPAGTILWALDELDQVLPSETVRALGPRYQEILEHFGYRDEADRTVLCWDLGRYMNHSCDPNCIGPGHGRFDIAVREIGAGVEVTTDYACLNIERAMTCRCGSASCRGRVREEDIEAISGQLDAQLRRALARIFDSPQPLLEWIDPQLLRQSVEQPEHSPSVLALIQPSTRRGVA